MKSELLTIRKEYPIQMLSQSCGHSGTSILWLWMAITIVCDSHTEHLKHKHGAAVPVTDVYCGTASHVYCGTVSHVSCGTVSHMYCGT